MHPAGSEPVKVAGVAALVALALRDGSVWQALLTQRALVAVLIALSTSVALATEPAVALIGSAARAQGWLAGTAGVLLAAQVSLLDGDGRRALQRGLACLGGAVAAYALLQWAGLDPWHWRGQPDARAMATLGNPTVLAGWLLLTLPLTGLQVKTASRRAPWMMLGVLQAGGLLASGTRSAWLALAATGLLLMAWDARRRWLLLGLPILLVLALLAAAWRPASLQDRAWLWQVAVHALVDPPLQVDLAGEPDAQASLRRWVGHGPDGQQPVLAAARARVPGVREEAAGWDADRAHQWALDRALEGGALGVLAGLALAAVVAVRLQRARRDPRTHAEATALCLALGAWAVHLQAAFALTGDRVLGWICIGLVLALAAPADSRTAARLGRRRRWRAPAVGLALGLLLLTLAAVGWVPTAWQQRLAPALAGPVISVLVDSNGQVWAGTETGLSRIAPDGTVAPTWPAEAAARSAVYDIEQARDGRLWLAVYGGGVATLDPRTGAVERMRNDPRIAGSVPEDSVRTMMLDRSGLLWVGGDVHGVARADPSGAKFRYLLDDDSTRPFVDTNNVRCLFEDQRGSLWIGTEGDGLKRYDKRARTFEYFLDVLRDAMPAAERGDELRVFAIAAAGPDGHLWISTNHGVFRLDPAARKATALPVDPARADALPDATVRSMLVGRDGSLWLGTFSAGLVRVQFDANRWTRFASIQGDDATLWHNAVLALHEDRLGRIWIGTFDGLNLLDPVSGLMRRIPRGGADRQSLAGNLVRAIHESDDGTIWVGSHNGLSRLDELTPDGARFRRYLARDGLPNATVYAILEDGRGDLWISTNRGITRFERDSEHFRRFSLEDGLQGLEFNGGAALKLRDGRLAFGGSQGVNLFQPERMTLSDYQPRLAFTGLQMFGGGVMLTAIGLGLGE